MTTTIGEGREPSVAEDGRTVVFTTGGSSRINDTDENGDYSDIYAVDLGSSKVSRISIDLPQPAAAASVNPSASGDGRFVAFRSKASNLTPTEDINLLWDVFVFDRTNGTIGRASGDPDEVWMEPSVGPSIDASGSVVTFSSRHPTDAADKRNDFDLYVVMRAADHTKKGDGSFEPSPTLLPAPSSQLPARRYI